MVTTEKPSPPGSPRGPRPVEAGPDATASQPSVASPAPARSSRWSQRAGEAWTSARLRWQARQRPLPRWSSNLLTAGLVTVLDWSAWAGLRPGLDISWQAGTAYAFTHHLQWGPQVDFTYGPYGFAGFLQPLYLPTALVSFLYILVVTWLLAALLVTGMRRYWGLLGAGVATWAVVGAAWAVGRSADFAPVVGLGMAFLLVQERSQRAREWLAVGAGALLGFSVLVKFSDAVGLVAVVLVAPLGAATSWAGRARTVLAGTGASVGAFLGGWLVAGQALGNLVPFARVSLSLAEGYSAGMGTPLVERAAGWWAALAVVALAVVTAAALARQRPATRVAVGVMLAAWCWAVVKDGFVAGNHYPGFFRLVLCAVALLAVLRAPRRVFVAGLSVVGVIALALTVVPRLDPLLSARNFVSEVADMASPARFAALEASSRRTVARREGVQRAARLVDGHTVAFEPWEDLLAWDLTRTKWDPEPVLQSYSAFTLSTDRMDASFISSGAAPQRILYQHRRTGFAGRDQYMDPPATTVAVYCHYAQLAVKGQWQVLEKVPGRCGPAHVLGVAHVHFGQPVHVPPAAPGQLVVARFEMRASAFDRVEGLLLRPPLTYLTTWGSVAPGTRRGHHGSRHLFVTGTAADDHVLAAPASLGYSPEFRPPDVHWLELSGDGYARGSGDITVTFLAVPMAGATAP